MPTQTLTPTYTPTDITEFTPTFTYTPTDTPEFTPTFTPTPTDVTLLDLDVKYICLQGVQQRWTVTNPNDFEINFDWEVIGKPESGNGTVPALGSAEFLTSGGNHTVIVRYSYANLPLRSIEIPAVRTCFDEEVDPTNTPVPTLPQPQSTPSVLIPVTGIDLGDAPLSPLHGHLINLGLGLIGLGMVLQGASKQFKA